MTSHCNKVLQNFMFKVLLNEYIAITSMLEGVFSYWPVFDNIDRTELL